MPSKGISVYSYISPAVEGYEVGFSIPGEDVLHTSAQNFTPRRLELDSANIPGADNFTGRLEWKVFRYGEVVASAYNDISTLTGKLTGGEMVSTQDFHPIVLEDAIITYGFYNAGRGEVGLTKRDQCYVTICSTDNRAWMGDLAPVGSMEAQKPFSRFALAAPHDNGMNSMDSCDAVFQHLDGDMLAAVRELVPMLAHIRHIPDGFLMEKLPHIVYGLAITQKKEIAVMLNMGARYFEFRPAKLLPIFQKISSLPDTYYFQHACIPGLAFDAFLRAQVAFLDENPTEIVTIHIRWDNIVADCERPTEEQIGQLLTDACATTAVQPLTWGGRECFSQPIDELRSTGKRLICVIEADKYDSWTAEAYATLSADSILARFEGMTTEGQESSDLTVLQCQATSQSIKEVMIYSVVEAGAVSSCLTSTKAALDTRTLPWIRENALERLQAERTIVIMNDFIDGATTDTSILLSKQRLAL
ncbi:PLC-like phosphodiesterase [Aspergillus fijiensis CBS 313.89]|uniref:PLC-like phosphodiesterase n=1 Tax=Aspergillus fijiensis CBS 313.89 TaxID=1448319 RepID=A0A8G1RH42_9EURO|nr:PLC-like phosphodiesterase [Aspergillus fijiensis CBS 313.89]RAK71680.1 PLC-like phosphodiesterase [Aspergillus fijiensis CBS 313.89]